MSQKILYKFSVPRKLENKVSVKKLIEGKEVEVLETITSVQLEKFAILDPSRRTRENGEFFYAKTVNELMKKGLMSRFMLSKRYDNDGGPFSEPENKALQKIEERKRELSGIYFTEKLKTQQKEDDSKTEEELKTLELTILAELTELQRRTEDIHAPYKDLFAQTAESKARDRTVIWWLFALLLKHDEALNEYVPVFPSAEYEKNMEALEKYEETADAFNKAFIERSLFYVSYWISGGDFSENSAEFMEREFRAAFPNYYPPAEEPKKEDVSEDSPAPR